MRHPFWVLAMTLVILGVSLWSLPRMKFNLDIYDSLDTNFASSRALWEMRNEYKDTNTVLLTFRLPDLKADTLCKLERFMRGYVRKTADISRSVSAFTLRRTELKGTNLSYPKLLSDPCMIDPIKDFRPAMDQIQQTPFRHLFSVSENKILYEISFSDEDISETEKKFRVEGINQLLLASQNFIKAELPNSEVQLFGQGSFRHYFKKLIAKDGLVNILILLFLIVFFRIFFGTWRSGLYLLLTLTMCLTMTFGAMAMFGVPIDFLTNGLFLLTVIGGTADFLFLSHAQFRSSLRESFESLVLPGFFTTVTTFLGFASLAISDFAIIQRFGLIAALAALVEWYTSFVVLPAILKAFRVERTWVDERRAWRIPWLRQLPKKNTPSWFNFAFLLVALSGIVAIFFLNYGDEPLKNFPEGHPLRMASSDFKKNHGWEGQVFMIFPAITSREDVHRLRRSLSSLPNVVAVEDPFEILSYMTPTSVPTFRALIDRELSQSSMFNRYFSRWDSVRVPLYLKSLSTEKLEATLTSAKKMCRGLCHLAGQSLVYLEYSQTLSITLVESFVVCIVLVLMTLFALTVLLKRKNFFAIAASSLIGPLFMISAMSILQVPISLVTSIFLAVIVGMTGDNAIQYLFASRTTLSEGIDQRAEASLILSLFLVLGSLTFLMHTLIPMRILGGLFVFGFSTTLLGDLWVLRFFIERKCPERQIQTQFPESDA